MYDEKFEKNEKLIWFTINKYFSNPAILRNNSLEKDDLYQIGAIGLLKAIKDYNSNKGSFSTYAIAKIWGEIKIVLRKSKGSFGINFSRQVLDVFYKVKKLESIPTLKEIMDEFKLSKSLAMEVIEMLDIKYNSLEEAIYKNKDGEIDITLAEMLEDEKSNFEKDIINKITKEEKLNSIPERNRKIIELALKGHTQREIGKEFNISQVHVSRIIKQSLKKFEEAV